jgi:hypothetical protein
VVLVLLTKMMMRMMAVWGSQAVDVCLDVPPPAPELLGRHVLLALPAAERADMHTHTETHTEASVANIRTPMICPLLVHAPDQTLVATTPNRGLHEARGSDQIRIVPSGYM